VELAIGTALAYQYSGKVKVLEAERAGFTKQITDLTAERDAAVKELDDIKRSESPRSGSAPRYRPSGKKVDVSTLSPSEALDALAADEAAKQNA